MPDNDKPPHGATKRKSLELPTDDSKQRTIETAKRKRGRESIMPAKGDDVTQYTLTPIAKKNRLQPESEVDEDRSDSNPPSPKGQGRRQSDGSDESTSPGPSTPPRINGPSPSEPPTPQNARETSRIGQIRKKVEKLDWDEKKQNRRKRPRAGRYRSGGRKTKGKSKRESGGAQSDDGASMFGDSNMETDDRAVKSDCETIGPSRSFGWAMDDDADDDQDSRNSSQGPDDRDASQESHAASQQSTVDAQVDSSQSTKFKEIGKGQGWKQATFSSFASVSSPFASVVGESPLDSQNTTNAESTEPEHVQGQSAAVEQTPSQPSQLPPSVLSPKSAEAALPVGTPVSPLPAKSNAGTSAPPPTPAAPTATRAVSPPNQQPLPKVTPIFGSSSFASGFAKYTSPFGAFASKIPAVGFGSQPSSDKNNNQSGRLGESPFGRAASPFSKASGSQSPSEADNNTSKESEKQPTSFLDALDSEDPSSKDDAEPAADSKPKFTEQELVTGEEEEENLAVSRCRLRELDSVSQDWPDRGRGVLKLNKHKQTGRYRLVMRTDHTFRLVLNCALYPGMPYQHATDKGLRFSFFEDSKLRTFFAVIPTGAAFAQLWERFEAAMAEIDPEGFAKRKAAESEEEENTTGEKSKEKTGTESAC